MTKIGGSRLDQVDEHSDIPANVKSPKQAGLLIPIRLLDGIPGFLAWLALALCIICAIHFPEILFLLAALLALYSASRFLIAGAANVYGLSRVRAAQVINWHERYNLHDAEDALRWEDIHHILIIPNYKEPVEILQRTLTNLVDMGEITRQMTIVLAMEAGEENGAQKAEALKMLYAGHFANFFYTIHPSGLPGEVKGKSSNESWAVQWVKRELVDVQDYDVDYCVVTTMDADTLWHKNYFYALTYSFAINPARYDRFWQAPIRYHSNIYQINPLLRLVNAYSTALELAYLAAPWWLSMPISSYSLSLRLMIISGYWDTDVISEDWHMFIKAFFTNHGNLKVVPIYLPFLATAVSGDNFWQSCRNRYEQTLRHAWGSKEVGYVILQMLRNPDVPLLKGIRLLMRVTHDVLLSGAGWIIVTVGSQLPLLLHPDFLERILTGAWDYPAFVLLQLSLAIVFVVGVAFWYLDVHVRPPRPRPMRITEGLLTLLSFPLLPLLTLIFVSLPVLHAQTRLLIGMPLNYQVAQKTL